jgi:hypothetical protein
MNRPFADSLGMAKPYGAIFGQPKPGSPAAQAGIEAGDVTPIVVCYLIYDWNKMVAVVDRWVF